MVLQVPEFGDRFWVYALYDARTDEFAEIGKPYGTKPGFYMIVGPNWKGETPKGITAVVRSSTELSFICPRIFKGDRAEDTKALQPVVNQIVGYPLSQFDGKMKTIDWSKVPHFPVPAGAVGETKWVVGPHEFYNGESQAWLPRRPAWSTWTSIRTCCGTRAGTLWSTKGPISASFKATSDIVRYRRRSATRRWTAGGLRNCSRTASAKRI
jgi:Protein of unknown function (DUF1254)